MRLVFDSMSWRNSGDIGDNSQFWLPAEILRMYRNPYTPDQVPSEILCDVQFQDGRISTGHFYSATKPQREMAEPEPQHEIRFIPDTTYGSGAMKRWNVQCCCGWSSPVAFFNKSSAEESAERHIRRGGRGIFG